MRFSVFPRNLTFMEENQQTRLISLSGKCQYNVNFPILVREIEIKSLLPLVVIQNITKNLISFRNMLFIGRDHLDYDMPLLGPLCYKLITIVTYYVETGLSCIVY